MQSVPLFQYAMRARGKLQACLTAGISKNIMRVGHFVHQPNAFSLFSRSMIFYCRTTIAFDHLRIWFKMSDLSYFLEVYWFINKFI